MAFKMFPKGLSWIWGAVAGAGSSVLAGRVLNNPDVWSPADGSQESTLRGILIGSVATPVVVGGAMAIFPRTRTAGWAAIGSGLAAAAVQAVYDRKDTLFAGGTMGLHTATVGQPVQVLNGSNMGLVVASEQQNLLGAGSPVEVLSAPADAGGVQIMNGAMNGGFGSSFGGNFLTNR